MVRAPQPGLGYFQGQPSGLTEALKALACLPPTSFSGPGCSPAASFSPSSSCLKQPGVSPSPGARGEREAAPSLAMPAGTDALTLCV